jgi:legume-like lectin family protein
MKCCKLAGVLAALWALACSDDGGISGRPASSTTEERDRPIATGSGGSSGGTASVGSSGGGRSGNEGNASELEDAAAPVPDGVSPVAIDAGTSTGGTASLVPGPASSSWQLNEFAKIVDGALELTPGIDDMNGHERGTAFWPTALASDGLAIEFDAEIIPTRFQGDGMTLALADVAAGAKPTDFGDSGGGLGYTSAPCCTGVKGIAVALDTSKNANDPSGNFLGVATGGQIDRMTWAATKTDGVPKWVGSKHRIGVTIAANALTVSIDGTEILHTTAGMPAIPKQVLVGFTAANGSNKSKHLVTSLVVTRR